MKKIKIVGSIAISSIIAFSSLGAAFASNNEMDTIKYSKSSSVNLTSLQKEFNKEKADKKNDKIKFRKCSVEDIEKLVKEGKISREKADKVLKKKAERRIRKENKKTNNVKSNN